jgi:3-methyladenine DNA glycosylase AlkC
MPRIETVKIKSDCLRGYIIINKEDLKEDQELFINKEVGNTNNEINTSEEVEKSAPWENTEEDND